MLRRVHCTVALLTSNPQIKTPKLKNYIHSKANYNGLVAGQAVNKPTLSVLTLCPISSRRRYTVPCSLDHLSRLYVALTISLSFLPFLYSPNSIPSSPITLSTIILHQSPSSIINKLATSYTPLHSITSKWVTTL